MKTKKVTSLHVGDQVVREGWTDSESYIREVVGYHDIKDERYYVLSGRRGLPYDHPQIVSGGAIAGGEWVLVAPEPRKVKGKIWINPDSGATRGYITGSAQNLYNSQEGYILVEFEGTEVQS